VRTDELIRRVTDLSVELLDAIEAAGYVSPDRLSGGSDPRWWSESDLHKVRDILRASLAAMRAAVLALDPPPEAILVDAVAIPGLRLPQLPIIHGDALCSSVAAASVIAKVERDRLLNELGRRYPAYGFEHHKGYGTPEHWQALSAFGPSAEHRLTYHGVVPGSGDPEPLPPSPRRGRAGKARRTG